MATAHESSQDFMEMEPIDAEAIRRTRSGSIPLVNSRAA